MAQQFTLADLEKAAPRVLSRLRAMAELPQYGTVAGQSVASLMWEELGHPSRGPVNDIDVFVNVNLPRPMRGLEALPPDSPYKPSRKVNSTSVSLREIGIENSHYDHVKFIALRMTTAILRTYQVGLVNYTLIHSAGVPSGSLGHGVDVSQDLIAGFDLNVVGVGINLESGEVVASPGFLEFLNTQKIRVETCNTPAHTLLRLANKYFGGQVLNATCDFPQERALLELALSCQQAPPKGHSTFSTVLNFGGGKYKALYDRYQEVMPPIQADARDMGNGETYTLYSMHPPAPTLAADVELKDSAHGDTALPHCVSQNIYIPDFPRIYELFHPERSLLDPQEIATRRAHFELLDKDASDGHNVRCLQAALGRPTIKLEVAGLDDDESVVFFFNQECAKDPARAAKAAQAMSELTPVEISVIMRQGYRADTALALYENRTATWKTLLRETGPRLITDVGQFDLSTPHHPQRIAQLQEILGWMQEMGEQGTEVARLVLPCHKEGGETSHHFKGLLHGYPQEQRLGVATQMMEWVLPSWPSLEDQPAAVRARALHLWIDAGLHVPQAFWRASSDEDLPLYTESACRALCNRVRHEERFHAIRDEVLYQVLPRLTDEQLALNKGRLIRAALITQGYDALQSTLSRHPSSVLLDEALSRVIENINPVSWGNSAWWGPTENDYEEKQWTQTPNQLDLVAIESIRLARNTEVVAAPVASAPRRSPRL